MPAFEACVGPGHVRPGGAGDAVDGVVPAWVVEPASTEEVSRCLAAASARGLRVVARGGGTKLERGAPPAACDVVLCTRRLDRVLEHVADDLVLKAQAGVLLRDVQERVASAGQWLALDPPQAAATLGGIVACNDAGPRRLRHGTPRDLLIGVTVVLADGTIAKAGGKVVKNVAGYDLGKLFAGSLGTLGVITDMTFRLHPRPAGRWVVRLRVTSTDAAQAAVQSLLQSALVPAAVELDWRGGAGTLDVLFEGSSSALRSQAGTAVALLAAFGAAGDHDPDAWPADDAVRGPAALVLKVATLPADQAATIRDVASATTACANEARLRGHAASGVLFLELGAAADDLAVDVVDRLRRAVTARGGSAVVLRAPAAVKRRLDVWGPVGGGLELMRSVKRQFDPQALLSPGRFVGGI